MLLETFKMLNEIFKSKQFWNVKKIQLKLNFAETWAHLVFKTTFKN